MTKSNAELAREYVDDAMRGTVYGSLTQVHGREAVLTAANVLAVLATADAMRRPPGVATPPEPQYKVGDSDPTRNHGLTWCDQQSAGRLCTWAKGHGGDHVAGDGDEICAVWS